uniref:Callose synthase 10 n=1 Tax=Rhizophora mucronata TaxID=61149 RepID=A0A2P2MBJ2_RHIMU
MILVCFVFVFLLCLDLCIQPQKICQLPAIDAIHARSHINITHHSPLSCRCLH